MRIRSENPRVARLLVAPVAIGVLGPSTEIVWQA
jgi:hypothetical protein